MFGGGGVCLVAVVCACLWVRLSVCWMCSVFGASRSGVIVRVLDLVLVLCSIGSV